MKLLFVTQQIDPSHPVLGATSAKVEALARCVDEVVVLADTAVPEALPRNCRSRTYRSAFRLGRGVRFETALARELRAGRPTVIVAHMCPIYAVLAAPLARPLRVPIVLWFAHWRASMLLRAAERASTAIASVDARSFPLSSRKLHAIGHGIDTSAFRCSTAAPNVPFRLLALGRYSAAKGLDVVVRAVAETDAVLTVRGPALTSEERAYRRQLGELVADLGLADRVSLADAVPPAKVPALYAESDALVNNMRAGAPDKVVYEAAASCLPILASNPVFDGLLDPEFRFDREDPHDLARRIRALQALDHSRRDAVGRELRRRAERCHSVDHWADGLLRAVGVA